MSRNGRTNNKKPSDGQNLVTILFVLGVIGWGFFAIDRLTESETTSRNVRVQGRALGQESGWKKELRDWLTRRLTSEPTQKVTGRQSVSRNIPEKDTGVPLLPEPTGFRKDEERVEAAAESETVKEASETSASFLFYKLNDKGQPVLSRVARNLEAEQGNLKSYLAELIKGPSTEEVDRDFIDSFIHKPRILSAKIAGQCAILNFDAKFGAGVSHQTLRFQVKQIYRNLAEWKGVTCLEILIGGRHQPHLGADGLYFPRRMDAAWLKQNL